MAGPHGNGINTNNFNDDNPPWWSPGFTSRKATMREFVILLLGSLSLYIVLHWPIPSGPPLSITADQDREIVISEINGIQQEIFDLMNPAPGVMSTTATATATASPDPTPAPPASSIVTTRPTQSKTITEAEVKRWQEKRNQWMQKIELFLQERPGKTENIYHRFVALDQQLSQLSDVVQQQQPQLILKALRNYQVNLVQLRSLLQEPTLFWEDDKKWLEVVFWSLFGTLLYLIQQTAEYYLRESKNHQNHEGVKFGEIADTYLIRRKPQYYLFLLQSPFLALVILWTLSAANFSIAGVSLVFSQLTSPVLVSLAFILGLFNRVAVTQLSLIVAAIFGDAWKKTVRKIDIDPSCAVVYYGDFQQFDVIPDVKVKWSIWSNPALGTIDTATGMYIAPPDLDYYWDKDGWLRVFDQKDLVKPYVILKAVREDEESISSLALVILKEKPEQKMMSNASSTTQEITQGNGHDPEMVSATTSAAEEQNEDQPPQPSQ